MAQAWGRAIVVGASSGIGEELARQLVAQGCRVALVARRVEVLQHLADTLNAQSPNSALVYPHDVLNYAEPRTLLPRIAHDLGGLDVIFYAAGVMPRIAPNEYDFEKDRLQIEVNLLGAIAWLNEAAQRFERAGGGTIVGISSVAGERGRMTMPVYCTSKAALNTYLEALRNRLARHGVKVVTVKPGPVQTPMTEGLKMPLMITAAQAAQAIIKAGRRGAVNAYIPGVWRMIFLILRNVPSFLFAKLKL